MRKRLVDYRKRIDALLADDASDAASRRVVGWDAVIEEHLVQISFFQHERLVHLLVTLAFALMELACAVATALTVQPLVAVLMLAFLVLLVPYIVHYYFLENETQKLYAQYDLMLQKRRERFANPGQARKEAGKASNVVSNASEKIG